MEWEENEDPKAMAEMMSMRDYFLDLNKPKVFDPYSDQSEVIRIEKDFEMMVSSMEEAGINNPKQLSVFEFYIRVQHFEKKYKPKNQLNNS